MTSSFYKVYEISQDHLSVTVEEYVVDRLEEDPNVSSRTLAREVGISQSKVINVLLKNLYKPYHFTPEQGLNRPDCQKRVITLLRPTRARY